MNPSLVIVHGGRHRCVAGEWRGNGEWSEVAKLYAPTRGSAWVAVEGRRTTLKPGGLYLIPPYHRLDFATDRELVVDWLHFSVISPQLHAWLAAMSEVRRLSAAYAARWRCVTAALRLFFQTPTPARACRVQAMILEVVGVVLEQATDGGVDARYERLMPALRLMDDQIMQPPTLAEMAHTINVSPEHFHRLFRERFRVTPFAYLLHRRMTEAYRLLTEGMLRVKEVAAACGYDDPYYFSRLFRQHFGCTPREVRAGKAWPRP